MNYNRYEAINYARAWAYGRNPKFYNFDALGGDCTNFVSQCLYAGCGRMNFTRDTGWYYNSLNNRAAGWSGVEPLYNFLIFNKGPGPYAKELPLSNAQPGDVIQLSFDKNTYGHSLFVIDAETPDEDGIKIATHTYDTYGRALSSYFYTACRLLHIEGYR